ncbi:NAD dependent epimerase/dehydratase family protein [Salmonella enterica subsp. arizonae]|uniref:NAD dependent epimerase/dehydratase family protein n=1 Tax=Salmonella enterica subsp. arizonae TaxID=59203 RepID=A0A379SX86_SALER|nr:NAD dependent epimerase/dehydratase family protein [Salmonella enterica subsp. arizonae]
MGHKLAKGRPPHALLKPGDTVDSWKVIIVEPEKQLTLLFGMKAPGLGRLSFTLRDKGRYREIDVRAWVASTRYAGPDLLAIDDSGAPVYFPWNGKAYCQTCRTNHRKMRKLTVFFHVSHCIQT